MVRDRDNLIRSLGSCKAVTLIRKSSPILILASHPILFSRFSLLFSRFSLPFLYLQLGFSMLTSESPIPPTTSYSAFDLLGSYLVT